TRVVASRVRTPRAVWVSVTARRLVSLVRVRSWEGDNSVPSQPWRASTPPRQTVTTSLTARTMAASSRARSRPRRASSATHGWTATTCPGETSPSGGGGSPTGADETGAGQVPGEVPAAEDSPVTGEPPVGPDPPVGPELSCTARPRTGTTSTTRGSGACSACPVSHPPIQDSITVTLTVPRLPCAFPSHAHPAVTGCSPRPAPTTYPSEGPSPSRPLDEGAADHLRLAHLFEGRQGLWTACRAPSTQRAMP